MKKSLFVVMVFAAASGGVFAESPRESQPMAQSEEPDLYGLFLEKWTGGDAQVIHIARTAEAPSAEAMTEYPHINRRLFTKCSTVARLVGSLPGDPSGNRL